MCSESHMTSSAAEDPSQRTIMDIKKTMSEEERESYVAALRTVYWIATEEIANKKYASLLNFQRHQGVTEIVKLKRGGNSTKESPQVFNEMLNALNEVLIMNASQCLLILQIINIIYLLYMRNMIIPITK